MRADWFNLFNAKKKSYKEVANSYVDTDLLDRVLSHENSIVNGPRGSGKTTLLKMCHQGAIENWPNDIYDKYKNKANFSSVYVPVDVKFRVFADNMSDTYRNSKLEKSVRNNIEVGLYCSIILRQMIECFAYKIGYVDSGNVKREHNRVRVNKSDVSHLCRNIAHIWNLELSVASFEGIISSINKSSSRLERNIHKFSMLSYDKQKNIISESRIPSYGLYLIEQSLREFDNIVLNRNSRWCVLFDELELAPQSVLIDLLSRLRVGGEYVAYKLAVSPAYSLHAKKILANYKPIHGGDYQEIRLWQRNDRQKTEFCNKLWDQIVVSKGLDPSRVTAGKVVRGSGSSLLNRKQYHDDSSDIEQFVRLVDFDDSFREYMRRKGALDDNGFVLESRLKDSVFRKISPYVILRNYYSTSGRARSRKSNHPYLGASELFRITEGNPRWFIGLFSFLVDRYLEHGKVTYRDQNEGLEELQRQADRLLSSAITGANERLSGGVAGLVFEIGSALSNKFYKSRFSADPPLSFFITKNDSTVIAEGVRTAINSGALVLIDAPSFDEENVFNTRIRLAYVYAPQYRLPLRRGRRVSLSSLIPDYIKDHQSVFNPGQTELFN